MSRRVENAVILDGPAAAMLSQAADLNSLRIKARGRSDRLYSLLHDIRMVELAYLSSAGGNERRKATETDQAEVRTVTTIDLARRAHVDPRTIRNHIRLGILRAHKLNRTWTITTEDAEQYLRMKGPQQ